MVRVSWAAGAAPDGAGTTRARASAANWPKMPHRRGRIVTSANVPADVSKGAAAMGKPEFRGRVPGTGCAPLPPLGGYGGTRGRGRSSGAHHAGRRAPTVLCNSGLPDRSSVAGSRIRLSRGELEKPRRFRPTLRWRKRGQAALEPPLVIKTPAGNSAVSRLAAIGNAVFQVRGAQSAETLIR